MGFDDGLLSFTEQLFLPTQNLVYVLIIIIYIRARWWCSSHCLGWLAINITGSSSNPFFYSVIQSSGSFSLTHQTDIRGLSTMILLYLFAYFHNISITLEIIVCLSVSFSSYCFLQARASVYVSFYSQCQDHHLACNVSQ